MTGPRNAPPPHHHSRAISSRIDGRPLLQWSYIYRLAIFTSYISIYINTLYYIFSAGQTSHTHHRGKRRERKIPRSDGAAGATVGCSRRVGKAIATRKSPSHHYRRPDFSSRQCTYIYSLNVYYAHIYMYISAIYIHVYARTVKSSDPTGRRGYPSSARSTPAGPRTAPRQRTFASRSAAAKMEGDSRDSPLKRHSVATETTPPTIATATATVTATAAAAATTTTACPSVSPYYIVPSTYSSYNMYSKRI